MLIEVIISSVILFVAVKQIKMVRNILYSTKVSLVYNSMATWSMLKDNLAKNKLQPLEYPDRRGEVAVVTGGGRGIGEHVVRGLAMCGMTIVVGARDPERCKDLIKDVLTHSRCTIEAVKLDLSSLKSVRRFADEINEKHAKVHLLVNNAGVCFGGYEETEDGFESKLATNYIGHFLLSHLLLPNLERAGKDADARIVNVSSCSHPAVDRIRFEDINMKNNFNTLAAYAQSKLAQLMFSRYLSRELVSRRSSVLSVAVHPGVVASGMARDRKWLKAVNNLLATESFGGRLVLYCCLHPNIKTADFIHLDKEGYSSEYSRNEAEQIKLFQYTCEILKISDFFHKSSDK